MLRTYGLTHIALYVADLDRSLRFYGALLGAVELYRDASKVEIGVPGAHDVISLELAPEVSARETGSIAHFGFRLVSPVAPDAIATEVERAGGVIEEKGEFTPGEGYVFARDPDGYLFELWYEPESPTRPG
ncbi:MAG TPA: VOC family protein [Dehalococcoidia bacterium]|nr:VOC family protein [Dehalococcoidia bacterium]